MADRTNTITTVYKVNTVDVQNATIKIQQADAATNKLNQDAVAAGQKIAAAFNGTGLTLQELNAKLIVLKERIATSSDPTKLAQLSAQYKQLDTQIQQVTSSLFKQETAQKAASQSIGQLYTGVKLLITAGLVKELADATINMARLGGQVEGVKRQFDKLPNSVLLMYQLKQATHGTVDELTLMQKALQAQNFGIPVQKLAGLLEFATIRAQQTGISVDYLVNSIVTGLGRNSVKILDNLQINIGELQKRVKETGLTTQEVAITMIGESLQKMDKYVNTSETEVNKLNTAWKELGQTVAYGGSKNGWLGKTISGVSELVLSLRFLVLGQKAYTEEANKTFAAKSLDEFLKKNKDVTNELQLEFLIKEKIAKLSSDRFKTSQSISEFSAGLATQRGDGIISDDAGRTKTREALDQMNKRRDRLTAEIELYKTYQITIGNVGEAEEKEAAAGDKQVETLDEKIDRVRKESAARIAATKALEDILEKQYGSLESKSKDLHVTGVPHKDTLSIATPTDVIPGQPPLSSYQTFWDRVGQGFEDLGKRVRKNNAQTEEDVRRQYQALAKETLNTLQTISTDILQGVQQREAQAFQDRIDATKKFYDHQIELAGDNSALKTKLQEKENAKLAQIDKERATAAKKAALTTIVINTAIGAAKALAEGGWPLGIAYAALIAAAGAVQYDIAARAKYAKGVINLKGPGTETSDDIPAMLSRGESVMTAKETRENMSTLQMIRAGKLNDKMLARIVERNGGSQQALSVAPIVDAIKAQVFPNVAEISGTLYEVKTKSKNARILTRSKYGNFKG